ncbi:MAG: hypothetical protein Q9O74_09130 [Planctomycetota bacterium]|nr:hypothetical protein [Planctomycetota bacterium]
MKSLLIKATICAVSVLLAGQAATAQIHPLEGLDPSGFHTNNPTDWFRGYEFNVNADGITAVEIGMRTPATGQAATLELWDSNTQTLLSSTAATTHGNSWMYYDIPNVALANGGTYVVGMRVVGTADYFFSWDLGDEWYPTGDIEYTTMRFHNNGFESYPTSTLDGFQYGVVDIGYTIPAPAGAALLAMGGLVVVRRRRA